MQCGARQHQQDAEQIARGQPSGQGIEQGAPRQLARDDEQGAGQGADPADGPAADGDEQRPQHPAEQQPGIEPGEPLPGGPLEDEQGAEQPEAEQVVGKGAVMAPRALARRPLRVRDRLTATPFSSPSRINKVMVSLLMQHDKQGADQHQQGGERVLPRGAAASQSEPAEAIAQGPKQQLAEQQQGQGARHAEG